MKKGKIKEFSFRLFLPITLFFVSVVVVILAFFLINQKVTERVVNDSFKHTTNTINVVSKQSHIESYSKSLKSYSNQELNIISLVLSDVRYDTQFLASLSTNRYNDNIETRVNAVKPPKNVHDDSVSCKLIYDINAVNVNEPLPRDIRVLSTVSRDLIYSVVDSDYVDRAFVLTDSGICLIADNENEKWFDSEGSVKKIDVIRKKWYKESKVATVSDLYYDYDIKGDNEVLTSVSSFYRDGVKYGIVGQEINVGKLHYALNNQNNPDGYESMIVDNANSIIYCSSDAIYKILDNNSATVKSIVDSLKNAKNTASVIRIGDDEYLAVSSQLEDDEWYAIAFVDADILNGEIEKLENILSTEEEDLNNIISKNVWRLVINIIALMLAMTIISLMIIKVLSKKLSEPLYLLSDKISKANVENLETIDVDNSSLELNKLSTTFNDMIKRMQDYVNHIKLMRSEKERMQVELDYARKIQQDMLPHSFPVYPKNKSFDLYALNIPEMEVGGDFYDYLLIDNLLYLIIADVSGSGMPAALFMAKSKSQLHSILRYEKDLVKVITVVNKELCQNNKENYFVTMAIYCIDLNTNEVTSVNAGHEAPVIVRRDGTINMLEEYHSPAIATDESLEFKTNKFKLEIGDLLFLYTDGVVEAVNKKDELYRIERLVSELKEVHNRTTYDIVTRVKNSVEDFSDVEEQYDDITMMAYKCTYFEEKTIEKNNEISKYEILTNSDTINIEKIVNSIMMRICEDLKKDREGLGEVGMNVELVLEEELANIVDYAYANEMKEKGKDIINIKYCIDKSNKEIRFEIIDRGIEFNPLNAKEPNLDPDYKKRKVGGLGIHLIKTFVNDLRYEYKDNENHLYIIKSFE